MHPHHELSSRRHDQSRRACSHCPVDTTAAWISSPKTRTTASSGQAYATLLGYTDVLTMLDALLRGQSDLRMGHDLQQRHRPAGVREDHWPAIGLSEFSVDFSSEVEIPGRRTADARQPDRHDVAKAQSAARRAAARAVDEQRAIRVTAEIHDARRRGSDDHLFDVALQRRAVQRQRQRRPAGRRRSLHPGEHRRETKSAKGGRYLAAQADRASEQPPRALQQGAVVQPRSRSTLHAARRVRHSDLQRRRQADARRRTAAQPGIGGQERSRRRHRQLAGVAGGAGLSGQRYVHPFEGRTRTTRPNR